MIHAVPRDHDSIRAADHRIILAFGSETVIAEGPRRMAKRHFKIGFLEGGSFFRNCQVNEIVDREDQGRGREHGGLKPEVHI
jgi:hypothetical protein